MAAHSKEDIRMAKAFKIMKGGKDNVGFKRGMWWTKEYGGDDSVEWFRGEEVTDAEWIVLDVVLRFGETERELLRLRYGGGYVAGYRKCAKELRMHHEVFRKLFQPVSSRLKVYLDEKPQKGQ